MPGSGEPSYTELVYEVLRATPEPLTFQQVLDAVQQRRPISTANPRNTIRGVLTQGRQLVSVGGNRYAYLPNVLPGAVLRLPLRAKRPANAPLVYTDEVKGALWPSFLETGNRRDERPVTARLPDGTNVSLSLAILDQPGEWGCPMPQGLRTLLVDARVRAGDALLFRVVDSYARLVEMWLEPHAQRDAAIGGRNQALADAVEDILGRGNTDSRGLFELAPLLLARGLYHAEPAPDALEEVLAADDRFQHVGLGMWALAGVWPADSDFLDTLYPLGLMAGTSPLDPFAPAAVPDMRATLERHLQAIFELTEEHPPADEAEMNALLERYQQGELLPRSQRGTPTKQHRAQELVWQAWDTPLPVEKERLARQALHLWPDCADAYVILAEVTAEGPLQAAELYAKGVSAGERALGPAKWQEYTGMFWGVIETRPYMRARFNLAQTRWELGERAEAIADLWDMLRLDPQDHQGARYWLVEYLPLVGDDDGLGRVLAQFDEDESASFAFGRVLHAFRTLGDSPTTRQALRQAQKANRHVVDYLAGRKRLPLLPPASYVPGDPSEAMLSAHALLSGWQATPGALAWLRVVVPK